MMMIKAMLLALQTMKFFLRTGFGNSKTLFGGSTKTKVPHGHGGAVSAKNKMELLPLPLLGLAPYSSWPLLAWNLVTPFIYSAISGNCFCIAAIIYDDDIDDLLTWAQSACISDDEFL
jgi:hypothetical protein